MIRKQSKEKIEYVDENTNDVLAEVDFPFIDEKTICITKTFVDEKLRGQSFAKKLLEEVISFAKENNLTIKATCSYAKHYFEKNQISEYLE